MTTPRLRFDEQVGDYRAKLTIAGQLLVSYQGGPDVQHPWYKDPATRQPWMPRRSSFLAVITQAVRTGKFADLTPQYSS